MENEIPKEIIESIKKNNQEHLLDYYTKLKSKEEKDDFIKQLSTNDFNLMTTLYSMYKKEQKDEKYESKDIEPIQSQYALSNLDNIDELIKKGHEEIYQGKVGLLILSGGLGTRLGFEHPKGKYNINMPSKKTLFEYLVNRFLSSQMNTKSILKDSKLEYKDCTLFIMTNVKTNTEIETFFKENNYFHLKKENIIFFPQTEVCALDLNGKVILTSPSKLYQAPDGNGGCFTAMKNNKIIDICIERKIDFINVVSIDNPLYKVLDPLFIGLTILKGKSGINQMSAKFTKKINPEQKTGNFLIYKNKPMMLDYMEMPNDLKYKKKDNGDLVYNASNILDYLISVNFLKNVLLDEEKMKILIGEFHILKKKFDACYFNKEKNEFEIKKNTDGLKFEIFFNSIFEFAEKEGLLLFETEEKNEFSPVKNHDGEKSNTPSLTRIKMSNVFKKWFKENGGEILNDDEKKILEISFLNCYDGKNLFDNGEVPKKIDMKDVKDGIYFKNSKIEK